MRGSVKGREERKKKKAKENRNGSGCHDIRSISTQTAVRGVQGAQNRRVRPEKGLGVKPKEKKEKEKSKDGQGARQAQSNVYAL